MRTADKLAAAIRAIATDPRHDQLAARAAEGYYDDYKSPLAAPIHALVTDARAVGLPEIAERAMEGEFDGTAEEAEAWARSPEGRAAAAQLGIIPRRDEATEPALDGAITAMNPDEKACPVCGRIVHRLSTDCPQCGYEFPRPDVDQDRA